MGSNPQPYSRIGVGIIFVVGVVATTRWNGTCSLLTSAKLSVGYLVVGITKELNKEPSLHCYPIYINYRWSVLQQCPASIPALKASCLSHVYSAVTVQDCASCPNVHVSNMLPNVIIQALLALQTLLDPSRPMTLSHMTSRSHALSPLQTNNNTTVLTLTLPKSVLT